MKAVLILAFVIFCALLSAADPSNQTSPVNSQSYKSPLSDKDGINLRTVNTWTGTTSVAWEIGTNWSLGSAPTSVQDVVIPTVSNSRYPVVYNSNDICQHVTIQSGAMLSISQGTLTVAYDFESYGTLTMTNTSGSLVVQGDIYFNSGASTNITVNAVIKVQRHVIFDNFSSVNMANGTLRLYGSVSAAIIAIAPTTINNLDLQKTSPSVVVFSEYTTSPLTINGTTHIYSGSTLLCTYTGTIVMKGNLTVDAGGTCQLEAGTLSMEGNSNTTITFNDANSYFNNLTINKGSAYSGTLGSDISVKGNLVIQSGILNSASHNISLGGNWTNSIGASGFVEAAGTVQLNGTGTQTMSTETFNILVLNKTAGEMTIPIGSNVTCVSYDWTAGAYSVSGGSFMVGDLADNAIYGNITLNSGLIEYHQGAGQYTDLSAILNISGGTFNVYGGQVNSVFGYPSPATLNMSNGVLDFKNVGIAISTSYTFNENISGGTLKTVGSFNCQRTDFTPFLGLLEMYGTTNAYLSCTTGSNICSLIINKEGSHSVVLNSDIILTYAITIQTGILDSASHNLTVGGDWTNNVGTSAFVAGSGTVTFSGPHNEYVYGSNNFMNVTINSSSVSINMYFMGFTVINGTLNNNGYTLFGYGANLNNVINDGTGKSISLYDAYTYSIASYTGGGYLTTYDSSHVIIADLTQSGIYGHYYVSDAAHLEIHQDVSSYIDLNGSVTIYDNGIMDIYGGVDNCRIANSGNCTFTMSSGEFNVKNQGILILSSAYACDFNITGGTIHCNGMWYDARGNFCPSGGTVEMAGSADSSITVFGASWFYNLSVNKETSREPSEPTQHLDSNNTITRSGDLYISTCSIKGALTIVAAHAVYLLGTVNILNAAPVTVNAGTLDLNGYTLACTGNVSISGALKLAAGSILQMASTKTLSILNGGTLLSLGTSTTPATITHNVSGYYSLNVENGGSIGANYTIFEYMDASGLYLKAGAHVDDTYSLNYCTFRNGATHSRLLWINNGQSFTVTGAVFPANTWLSDYNVSKTVNNGIVYFASWTGSFGGPTNEQDSFNHIYWQGYGTPPITNIHCSYITSTNRIQLNWTYPLTATSYKIYRSTNPYGAFTYYASTTSTTWSQVIPGVRYYYRVTAVVP